MGERLKRFNTELNTNVFIQIKDKTIHIIKGKDKNSKLICELDNKLLRRILDKKLIGIMLRLALILLLKDGTTIMTKQDSKLSNRICHIT